jgi:hypothetical protein
LRRVSCVIDTLLVPFIREYFQCSEKSISASLAQAVSRRPLTAKAPVRGQIVCEQSGTGTGYLRAYQFSPVGIIPAVLHIYSRITDAI